MPLDEIIVLRSSHDLVSFIGSTSSLVVIVNMTICTALLVASHF